MPLDPTTARVREVRHRISERFGHDPRRLAQHYMELQKRHADRLVRAAPRSGQATGAGRTAP